MLQYTIKLATVNDFRNYANMIARFHIGGWVLADGERIYISSILDIMYHVPQYDMLMVLDVYREEEIPALEVYMKENGLMRSPEDQKLKCS